MPNLVDHANDSQKFAAEAALGLLLGYRKEVYMTAVSELYEQLVKERKETEAKSNGND